MLIVVLDWLLYIVALVEAVDDLDASILFVSVGLRVLDIVSVIRPDIV